MTWILDANYFAYFDQTATKQGMVIPIFRKKVYPKNLKQPRKTRRICDSDTKIFMGPRASLEIWLKGEIEKRIIIKKNSQTFREIIFFMYFLS